MASRKETPRTESSTNIKPKASIDDDGVFIVDFTDKEESSWIRFTEWTFMLPSRESEITFTRGINEHLCGMMRHFDRPPSVKLTSLRNPEQKVILVFGHDTDANAFNMFLKYIDVRKTVVSFLQKIKIPVEDIKLRVRLTRTGQSAGQQDKGYNCIFDPTPDYPEEEKSETTWFCIPDNPNLEVDNETSNSEFTRFKDNIRKSFRACLRRVSTGSVIFTFHHGSTEDAMEMISKHDEVRAMILVCLQGIDSTVKDIQMEVQLQDFIDPRSLPEHCDQDKRYVDKQEHDKAVKDLSDQVATLTLQLQEVKEKERVQLADFRLSMWKTRPGSPQPSESSGFFTTTDTMTEAGDEELQDTKGPVTRKKADSKAWSQMEARRPGPTQKSDEPATTRERDTRKSGTPSRPDTRATPTPARRDARADADLRVACREGKLAEVKRILDKGRADVNCRSVYGRTPVMWAAWLGHGDVVELLVSRGADVSLVDDLGNNTLHYACMGGDRKTVEFVLSLEGVDINVRNNDGETAADVARDKGHHQLSDLLVSRGTQ